MDFHILGALEVTQDGRPVALGGGRQSALLALLVVERNRAVGADRIVEELWNGDAPATAPKVVQNLVSQLRRLGADGILQTRGHGYELVVPDEALDAARFEQRLGEGRDALARGDAATASSLLGDALAMWRGPALAGFADMPWARAEAARLEDRRLVALERRIDADLALGRHADLIGELETAIAHEPLREGLRGQLMLALYRSGRQAEALAAFQAARRTLVEELGIEPGPDLTALHESILRHDPDLDLPAPRRARMDPRARRRGGALLAAGGAALVIAAIAALVLIRGGGGGGGAAASAGGGTLVAFDAHTGRVRERVPAGRTPSTLAAGAGQLWMVDAEARTVVRVDAASRDVETLATGATPTDVAVGGGAVWVANATPRKDSAILGPVPEEVVRIDPATRLQRVARLPRSGTITDTWPEARVAVTRQAVWAVTADGSLARIDPPTATVTGTVPRVRVSAIAAGGAGLWAIGLDGSLLHLDEGTGAVRRRVRLPMQDLGTLVVGPTAAWTTGWSDGKLYRVEPSGAIGSVTVGEGVTDLAVAEPEVWAVSPVSGSVTRVDAASMRVVRSTPVEGEPRSLAADGGTMWMAVTRPAEALSTKVAGVRPLPASRCAPVLAGNGGAADVLVVSDLPLQGDTRLSSVQMAQAITFVLREHHFRAGRFRIAYQSCDDALASTGLFDSARCTTNARAYAGDRDVIGVIGTLNSGCAASMLPELNRAPLGMVSPLNSYVGLTRPAEIPGMLPSLYPTGRRNFVRVYPGDDIQSGALARLARDRGRHRAFVLDDGAAGYSDLIAEAFATAAGRLGVGVVGHARWNPHQRSFGRLVERVAGRHPDAVLVSGFGATSGRLIHALRDRLGDDVDILGPDGLGPPATLEHYAGAAARGVFYSVSNIVPDRLPPAGAGFVERFARTQAGVTVEAFAVYAAQATEVMLDAIARSDGTRASVIGAMFSARLHDSLIGDIAFDRRGDAVAAPVTVLRVVGGGSGDSIASVKGAAVERVDHIDPAFVTRRPAG